MAIRITGLASGLDTESLVSELVSAYRLKEQKYEKAQTKLSWKQAAWKSLNTKVNSLFSSINSLRFSSAYNMKTTTISNSTKATVTAGSSAINGTQSLQINSLAKSQYITGGVIAAATADSSGSTKLTSDSTLGDLGLTTSGTITVTKAGETTGTEITVTADTTLSSLASSLTNISGVTGRFDATNQRFFVTASDSGTENAFTLSGSDDVLSKLGLTSGSGAVEVAAQDAEIVLNNATFTSSSNKFTVNGLTIDCLEETGSETLSITTSTDTQGLYDQIKDFLSQYNSIINEMTSLYNASSAKGYEPLTSDEKSAMTDTQIEEWEDKIKSALFRRDDTLDGIMNAMENAMSTSCYILDGGYTAYDSTNGYYTYNGVALTDDDGNNITTQSGVKAWADANGAKNYNFSTFGIATLGYLNAAENQQNAYHIDGDSDDADSKGNTDKLMSLLETDPDTVSAFMKSVTSSLYTAINNKMSATTLRSLNYIYNDKEMAQEYSDYTDTISDWEDKLSTIEDYYYSKFAAMESALSTLQSQSSSLSSLLS